MIELSPVSMVFILEVSIVLFLLLILLFFVSKNKSKEEEATSSKVIDKLQDTEKLKAKKLSELITQHCDLEPEDLDNLLVELKSNERNLYKQIIRIFLKRDIDLLGKIDKHIDKFAEPYCKILSHVSGGSGEKEKELEEKLNKVVEDNRRLADQLTIAMSTMDEISDEYTRVFSGTQTELELENSSKKMFSIFQKAGLRISETVVKES